MTKKIFTNEELDNILDELYELMESHRPNDETYLEELPELVEEMRFIDSSPVNTKEEIEKTIRLLHAFLTEWRPDSLDEEYLEEFDAILSRASVI